MLLLLPSLRSEMRTLYVGITWLKLKVFLEGDSLSGREKTVQYTVPGHGSKPVVGGDVLGAHSHILAHVLLDVPGKTQ